MKTTFIDRSPGLEKSYNILPLYIPAKWFRFEREASQPDSARWFWVEMLYGGEIF